MNKLFTKIAGLTLGLAMAIGVGTSLVEVDRIAAKASMVPSNTAVTSISAGQYIITNGTNYLSGYNNNHITRTAIGEKSIDSISTSYAFTLAVSGTGWSIYQNNQSKYIGYSSKTDFSQVASASTDAHRWTITPISNGSDKFTIFNIGTSARGWKDGGSDIRPYSSPSGEESYFKFYKLEEVSFGDLDSVSIKVPATKTAFKQGETFSPAGLILNASDGTNVKEVDSGFTFKIGNSVIDTSTILNSVGTFTVTVEYTEKTITKSTSYEITVSTPDSKLVIDQSAFDKLTTGSGYGPYNGLHVFGDYTIRTYQVMNQSSDMQFQKNNGYMYNVNPFISGIKMIRLSANLDNVTITLSTNTFEADSHVTTGDTTTVTSVSANSKYYVVPSGSTVYTYFKITCGNTTKSFTDIHVYSDDSGAERFATDFVAAFEDDDVCGTTDSRHNENNSSAVSAIWTSWKNVYGSLKESTQASFKNSETSKGIQAKSLYLHIVDRYKLAAWSNAPVGTNTSMILISDSSNNQLIIVVTIISVLSVASIGGYFFLRKRKENN